MGAGASTPREQTGGGKRKLRTPTRAEPKGSEYAESPFASSPFDSDIKNDAVDSKQTGASERRLKKMALGLPGYKDVQRDYDDTLEELGSFNHVSSQEWTEGVGAKLERLTDGPLIKKSTSEVQQSIDPRALAVRNANKSQVGPNGRPRPPPPRGRPGPPPKPGQAPNSVQAARAAALAGAGSATSQIVEAPSILAKPIGPKEGAPVIVSKSRPQSSNVTPLPSQRVVTPPPLTSERKAGTTPNSRVRTPIRTIKTSEPKYEAVKDESEDDSDEEVEDGGLYDWTAFDTSQSPVKTAPKKASEGSMSSASSSRNLTSSQRTASLDSLKPPETPPPGRGIPVRPFPNDEKDDEMYATFGPHEEARAIARPSRVPVLAIASPPPSEADRSFRIAGERGASQQSPGLSTPSPMRPMGKAPDGNKTPSQTALHAGGIHPSGQSPMIAKKTGPAPIPSDRKSSRDTMGSNSMGGGQRRAGQHNAPPKPSMKNPHEVKETTDVKRNKAQLPSALIHAKPTAGDWLNKRYIVNNYILLDALGAGSYGEVRLCKDRLTDHLYAVKIFSKDMLRKKKGGGTEETYFEDVKREIAVMKKLLHPNVLRLFEVLDDPNVNKMYLILEYMKKGDLINILKSRGGGGGGDDDYNFQPLSNIELWNIFRQVAAGIRYLHFQNVVHGDIKPQNLLIGDDGVVKIADFGISKMLHASGQKLADASGTPAFMSPELFDTGKEFSGQLADIWALGATMWMLKFGNPPFISKNIVSLSNKIQNDDLVFPGPCDDKLQDLLENMLQKKPSRRLTLQQVIMHPWMRTQPAPPSKFSQPASGTDTGTGRVSKTAGVNSMFAPPASYDKAHDKAMKEDVKLVTENEIYQSISGNAKVSMEASNEEEDVDVMATKWGNDVFEMVDEADIDSDYDSDSVDEETVDDSGDRSTKPKEAKQKKGFPAQSNGSTSTMQDTAVTMGTSGTAVTEHSEMSHEEELMRSKRFKKSHRKSNENMLTLSQAEMLDQVPELKRAGDEASAIKSWVGGEGPTSSSSSRTNSRESGASGVAISPNRRSKGSVDNDDEYETSNADMLTMDEFGAMMDTLALQPKDEEEETESSNPAVAYELTPSNFSAQLRNMHNNFGAAYHSEQGQRPTQEDRCVLIPDASTLRGVEESYGDDQLDHIKMMSLACVFDGHSGWKCAQYLTQHFPTALVQHEKFLSKQPEKALVDTALAIDKKVNELLRKDGDSSGCTGVIVLYDGRRRVLTIANVGDSMCVLSRGGRAVKAHKIHRLGNSDVLERERIEAAGGQVINNRVDGILAISRAFGDVSFKTGTDSKVVAMPDSNSEVITPMTEFAIIASDGLWDVMNPQLAVNFVRKMLSKQNDLQAASRELANEALARGSVDNVTVIIITWIGLADSPQKKKAK